MLNANPTIYRTKHQGVRIWTLAELDDTIIDPIDPDEVFDLVRSINDPEHPRTLEELGIVRPDQIHIHNQPVPIVHVEFTPTIPHCSMATLIGLCIRIRLVQTLAFYYKIMVTVSPGTHTNEEAINKQLNDKERVAAAMENDQLFRMASQCLGQI